MNNILIYYAGKTIPYNLFIDNELLQCYNKEKE